MNNTRKPTFFTSDLHIGHANSIIFDNRPFRDLEHMHQVLINNYNAIVPHDGICYFLGDIGLSNQKITADIISQLNGTKVLLLGNHDRKHNAMYSIGFDVVVDSMSLSIAGEIVTMSHYPLLDVFREDTKGMRGGKPGDPWHGNSKPRIRKRAVKDSGQFHLNAHIHSTPSERTLLRQFDVGVTCNNYRPVSISAIESWIAKTKLLQNDWRVVEGFEDYKVNGLGEIKSFKIHKEGKLRKLSIDKDGYLRIAFCRNGVNQSKPAHQVVGKAFLDNPNNYDQINHKNGIKHDNRVQNLEWCSHTQNQRHAWSTGLKKKVN